MPKGVALGDDKSVYTDGIPGEDPALHHMITTEKRGKENNPREERITKHKSQEDRTGFSGENSGKVEEIGQDKGKGKERKGRVGNRVG